MMRRFSLRSYFNRHPSVVLGLVGLTMLYGLARSVEALTHTRGAAHANWPAAIAVGLVVSLTLISVAVGWLPCARRLGPQASLWLVMALFLGLPVVFLVGLVYTRSAVMPEFGPPETVTTTFQLAAIAFMIPLYAGFAVLTALVYLSWVRSGKNLPDLPDRRNLRARKTTPPAARRSDPLTALIGPSKDGWSVTWLRVGGTPRPLSAPTLTAAADQATAAAAWRRSQPPGAAAELTLAIYPMHDTSGPTLEISGQPGSLTATNPDSGATAHGATLEDLLAAAQALEPAAHGLTLRWTRPITAPPKSIPPGEHPSPAS